MERSNGIRIPQAEFEQGLGQDWVWIPSADFKLVNSLIIELFDMFNQLPIRKKKVISSWLGRKEKLY